MAHLNCLPPRAAGVNYWFFLLAHLVVGVGIKQNEKCEMLLRKIDGERNVQNCGIYHELVPSFFEEMTRCRRQKHCRRRLDNPNGPSKFRKYRVFFPLLRMFTSARSVTVVPRLTAAAVATHTHRHISKR